MSSREYVIAQLDNLPDSVIEKIQEFISLQKIKLGMFGSDDEYLASLPTMSNSIAEGLTIPLSECVPLSEVWPDV